MPQIIINYHNPKALAHTFPELSERFANIIKVPTERIFIALNETPIYCAGEIDDSVCMIHLWWKARDAQTKTLVAQEIGDVIKQCGVKKVKVTFLDAPMESILTI